MSQPYVKQVACLDISLLSSREQLVPGRTCRLVYRDGRDEIKLVIEVEAKHRRLSIGFWDMSGDQRRRTQQNIPLVSSREPIGGPLAKRRLWFKCTSCRKPSTRIKLWVMTGEAVCYDCLVRRYPPEMRLYSRRTAGETLTCWLYTEGHRPIRASVGGIRCRRAVTPGTRRGRIQAAKSLRCP